MLDLGTVHKVAADVAADRRPDKSYSDEMEAAWYRMKIELDEFREKNPEAYIHIPPGLEGIPGSNDRNDYSPNQERQPDGKFGSGSGGGVVSKVTHFLGFGDVKKPSASEKLSLKVASEMAPTGTESETQRAAYREERDAFKQTLTEHQRNAIDYYTTDGYRWINIPLRQGQDREDIPDRSGAPVSDMIHHLDTAIASHQTKENLVLYRGIHGVKDPFVGLKQGAVIQDHGFPSTTLSKERAFGFSNDSTKQSADTIVEIHVPKGHNAAPVSWSFPEEQEYILPRASKFKVTNVIPDGRKTRVIVDVL